MGDSSKFFQTYFLNNFKELNHSMKNLNLKAGTNSTEKVEHDKRLEVKIAPYYTKDIQCTVSI